MIQVTKDTFLQHKNGETPMAGPITHISATGRDILIRLYWSTGNDVWNKHYDLISRDNGKTWSDPVLAHQNEPAEGGHMTYTEAGAVYHPERNKVAIITNYYLEKSTTSYTGDTTYKSHIVVSDPDNLTNAEGIVTDLGVAQGLAMSFCHPFVDARGRMIFPCQRPMKDKDGALAKRGFATYRSSLEYLSDYREAGLVIGEFQSDGSVSWRVGGMAPFDVETSSRGMCEPTVVELKDGRFAMICRGSNALYPGVKWGPKPGYKWLSYSEDGGETWSMCQPLACDDGSLIESGSNGSCAFRSIKNGKLYWIGNLCYDGGPADGNFPREPLFIAELTEDPVTIKRDAIAVIDKARSDESDKIQLSNFKLYQDYETGDIMLYMNRFAERGGYEDWGWHDTDLYRYRIVIE